MKHFEMAGLVDEYKKLVEDLEERADEDRLTDGAQPARAPATW